MKLQLRSNTLYDYVSIEKFENLRPTITPLDSCMVKGNSKYAAFSSYSPVEGSLAVLDLSKPISLNPSFPMIKGHGGDVLDFDFYPFNENFLITSSDSTLRLWNIPESFTKDLKEPITKLSGHAKKVNLVQFHPSAESVVASADLEGTVLIWDIEKQSFLLNIPATAGSFTSLEWNHNGSHILTACKDKNLRIGDPRANIWIQKWQGHENSKAQKAAWLGNSNFIVSVGFSKDHAREILLWDIANLKEPVQSQVVDQEPGILYPFYDSDLNILYTAGKGDNFIRSYEFDGGKLYNLHEHKSASIQKGVGFLPKRCLDVSQDEIMRVLKVTKNTLEFVSFGVLTKMEGFREDLFPPCISGEPSLRSEEWLTGQNQEPKRRPMNLEISGNSGTKILKININRSASEQKNFQSNSDFKQGQKSKNLEQALTDAQKEIQGLLKEKKLLIIKNNELMNEIERKNIDISSLHDDVYQLKKQIRQLVSEKNEEKTEGENEELSEY